MTTDIVPFEPAALSPDLAELIEENLMGEGIDSRDLPMAIFPSPGNLSWTVGDRAATEIKGVVITQMKTRAFYKDKYDQGGNDAPDCASNDGKFGVAEPIDQGEDLPTIQPFEDGVMSYFDANGREWRYGGDCESCPLNEYGSDLEGRKGKACREYRRLLVVTEDEPLPVVVRIPPAQLGLWRRFAGVLIGRKVRLSEAVIRLGLKKNGGGTDLDCTYLGRIEPDVREALLPLAPARQVAAPEPTLAIEAPAEEAVEPEPVEA